MAGWLHGVFAGEWLFVFPLCGFSLSLFCNYLYEVGFPLRLVRPLARVVLEPYLLVAVGAWACACVKSPLTPRSVSLPASPSS